MSDAVPRIFVFAFVASVACLIAMVAFRLLTGRIEIRGLLHGQAQMGGVEPERIQMLAVSIGGAIAYAAQAVATISTGAPHLPEVSSVLFDSMAGSQALYLIGKLVRLQQRKGA